MSEVKPTEAAPVPVQEVKETVIEKVTNSAGEVEIKETETISEVPIPAMQEQASTAPDTEADTEASADTEEAPRTTITAAFDALLARQAETAQARKDSEALDVAIVDAQGEIDRMISEQAGMPDVIAGFEGREEEAAEELRKAIAVRYTE